MDCLNSGPQLHNDTFLIILRNASVVLFVDFFIFCAIRLLVRLDNRSLPLDINTAVVIAISLFLDRLHNQGGDQDYVLFLEDRRTNYHL